MEEPAANSSPPPEDMETDQTEGKDKTQVKDNGKTQTKGKTQDSQDTAKTQDTGKTQDSQDTAKTRDTGKTQDTAKTRDTGKTQDASAESKPDDIDAEVTDESSQDTICMGPLEHEKDEPCNDTKETKSSDGDIINDAETNDSNSNSAVEKEDSESVKETSMDDSLGSGAETATDIITSAAAAADIAIPVLIKPVQTGDMNTLAETVNAKLNDDEQPWTDLVKQLVNSAGGQSSGTDREIVVILEDDQNKVMTDENGIPRLVLENGTNENSHDNVVEQREFRCWYCEEVFGSNAEREEHEKMHTESKFVLLICQECGQSFQKSEDFESHHQTCSGDGENKSLNDLDDMNSSFSGENSNSQTESVSPVKSSQGSSLDCVFCDTLFDSKESLKKHMVLRHQMVKDNAQPKFYCCKFCHVTLPDREVMIAHEDSHDRKHKTFPCEYCGKLFNRGRDVKEHIKRMHMGNAKGYKLTCDYCYVPFVTRKQLLDHLEQSHNIKRIKDVDPSENNYICRECGKEFHFKAKRQFDEHVATHTRDNLHSCRECGKTFVRERELGYHMARHRGEGRYVCSLCQKNFVLKWDLKKHLKNIHEIEEDGTLIKNLSPPNKKPKLMNIMDANITVMDDIFKVNPFVCRICHAHFETGISLRAHRKTHAEEDDAGTSTDANSFPYICSFCSKGFQSKSDFVEHVGEHTKGTQGQKKSALQAIAPKPAKPGAAITSPVQVITSPSKVPNTPPVPSPNTKHRFYRMDKGEGITFWHCCYTACLRSRTEYHSRDEFTAHIEAHKVANPEEPICEYCGRLFQLRRPRDLTYHKKVTGVRPCKYMMISLEKGDIEPKSLPPPPSDQSTHTCGCGKVLKGFKEFQLHVLSHKSTEDCKYCQYCGRNFENQKSLQDHLKDDSDDPCKYTSPGTDDIKRKTATTPTKDTKQSPVIVKPVVSPVAVVNNNVPARKSPAHSLKGDKPFVCGYCGKRFRGRSYLREHETMHTKKYDYECSQCDRKFTRAREVRYHEKKHDGTEPYKCPPCQKGFLTKANFKSHMDNFHDGTDDIFENNGTVRSKVVDIDDSININSSAFKCTFCCKHFNVLDHFKAHMEIVHDVEVSVVNEEEVKEDDDEAANENEENSTSDGGIAVAEIGPN